eukprot:4495289-Pyramimonas_sp.AAC.1
MILPSQETRSKTLLPNVQTAWYRWGLELCSCRPVSHRHIGRMPSDIFVSATTPGPLRKGSRVGNVALDI